MLTWIKLDGNNIVGHFHNPRIVMKEGSFSDHGYHAEIDVEHYLANEDGDYIYAYEDKARRLVKLSKTEIEAHPLYIKKREQEKIDERIEKVKRHEEFSKLLDSDLLNQKEKAEVQKRIVALSLSESR